MSAVAPAVAADPFDLDRIAAIAARLDLRQPNTEALESVVAEVVRHYEFNREPPPLEAVVDVATGVGKTYVVAAAIEYFAAEGVRDFAVVVPGRTILAKTVANFTPGHPKSLLGGMEVRPVVITSDTFATPAMRAAMDDPAQVKLYVFTVQSLLKPETKVGRKTHKFQEGLGKAFYAHLQGQENLFVFADEHHAYHGPAFSKAVRDLRPKVLLGLTATPHPRTPPDQIVYRYPLAAAIADKLVKTPVLVGRKDDRSDPRTKLLDGVRLLELKERAVAHWCADQGVPPVVPMMLVIAPSIAEAAEIEAIVADPGFAEGRYAAKVLTVHSDAPDEALAQLDKLEETGSPYRIVVSVGMLKEGWDVKNVYVIASLRASVSTILTEQTLGRGLRLPFGRYTGVELLDTLEVLGHERYEELLRKAGTLNEQFIDHRTRAVLRRDAEGNLVSTTETAEVGLTIVATDDGATTLPAASDTATATATAATDGTAVAKPAVGFGTIASVEGYTAKAEEQVARLAVELVPRDDLPSLLIPRLRMTQVTSTFSLSDITDLVRFRTLGHSIAADPVGALRRTRLDAQIVTAQDGQRTGRIEARRAQDAISSPALQLPLEEARRSLVAQVLAADVVPTRATERRGAEQIVDAFLGGMEPNAESTLSGYHDRAASRLIQEVTEAHRAYVAKPSYDEVVEVIAFAKRRTGKTETSRDTLGPFAKGVGYEGFKKSLYAQDWFDSSTERAVANILEDASEIDHWLRLQIGDLPILWNNGREYNPDFVAIDHAGIHWMVEAKMDKEMASADVQAKREAARRWANHVSAKAEQRVEWRYLLVSETDVRTVKGSWAALKGFGGG